MNFVPNNKTAFSLRKCYLLKPESPWRLIWEVFMMALLIFLGFMIPYSIAFQEQDKVISFSLDLISIIAFTADIIITLNTGIYLKGQLVMDRIAILKCYAKFWLWLDMFSVVPIDWILRSIDLGDMKSVKMLYFFRFLKTFKVFKLVRLAKLKIILVRIEEHSVNNSFLVFLRIFKDILYLLLVSNAVACYMFSVSSSYIGPDTFINNIINKSDTQPNTNWEMYISTLYWAFVTMAGIGYGDITPKTSLERMAGMLVMFSSCGVFGIVIGNIGSKLEKKSEKESIIRTRMLSLNVFLKDQNVPQELRSKCRNYFDYLNILEKDENYSIDTVIKNLPRSIQDNIIKYSDLKIIRASKLFDYLSDETIYNMTKCFISKIYSPLDSIIKENQIPEGMYFITKGCVEVFDIETSSTIALVQQGNIFGEIGFFGRIHCVSSVYSIRFTEVLFLSIKNFDKFIQKMPDVAKILKSIQKACRKEDFSSLGIVCYLCEEVGHVAKACNAIRNYENCKSVWVDERKYGKKINPYMDYREKKLKPIRKKVKRWDFSTKNILGRKRNTKQLFPKVRRLLGAIKRYVFNMPNFESEAYVGTEEIVSDNSTMRRYFNVDMILENSSDSESDKTINYVY